MGCTQLQRLHCPLLCCFILAQCSHSIFKIDIVLLSQYIIHINGSIFLPLDFPCLLYVCFITNVEYFYIVISFLPLIFVSLNYNKIVFLSKGVETSSALLDSHNLYDPLQSSFLFLYGLS